MLKIKLDNCCEPKVTMELTFEEKHFMDVLLIACRSFRGIEIADTETEEVIYTRYVSDEPFQIEKDHYIAETIATFIELLPYTTCPREF